MKPSTPRAAASLILLRHGGRHGDRAIEVLLVRRSPESSFMPGVWVFPGGVVEPDDVAAEAKAGRPRRSVRPRAPRLRSARAWRGGRDRAAGAHRPAPVVAVDHSGGRPRSLRHSLLRDPRAASFAGQAGRSRDDRGDLDLAGRGSGTPRGTICLSSSRRSSTWSRSCRTRAPTRCSRRLATDRSSRSCRGWSARARPCAWSSPANPATSARRSESDARTMFRS